MAANVRLHEMTRPQTRAQGLAYGAFMTLFMTFGMELYNNAIKMGINLQPGGFSNMRYDLIPEVLREIVFIAPVVFVISNLYGNRLGARLADRLIDPERDSSFFRSCVVIACTTLVMCPSMSLFASVLFNVVLAGAPSWSCPSFGSARCSRTSRSRSSGTSLWQAHCRVSVCGRLSALSDACSYRRYRAPSGM